MATVFGFILIFAVVALCIWLAVGLVRDIHAKRKARKNKTVEGANPPTDKNYKE